MSKTAEEKAAAKAAKEAAATGNQLETVEPKPVLDVENVDSDNDEIVISDPMDIRPQSLPLVVKVPASASEAQKDYARFLNAYAYQNPKKWGKKKDVLVKRLKMLAGKKIPNLGSVTVKQGEYTSSASYVFIPDGKGGEIYAGSNSDSTE